MPARGGEALVHYLNLLLDSPAASSLSCLFSFLQSSLLFPACFSFPPSPLEHPFTIFLSFCILAGNCKQKARLRKKDRFLLFLEILNVAEKETNFAFKWKTWSPREDRDKILYNKSKFSCILFSRCVCIQFSGVGNKKKGREYQLRISRHSAGGTPHTIWRSIALIIYITESPVTVPETWLCPSLFLPALSVFGSHFAQVLVGAFVLSVKRRFVCNEMFNGNDCA